MNYCNYRFPAPYDQIENVEKKWNLSPPVQQYDNLQNVPNTSQFYPKYMHPRQTRPSFLSNSRGCFTFNRRRFSRGNGFFGRPCFPRRCNFHLKRPPIHTRYYEMDGESMIHSPSSDIYSQSNNQYIHPRDKEYHGREYCREPILRDHENTVDVPYPNKNALEMAKYSEFAPPYDEWINKAYKMTKDPPTYQTTTNSLLNTQESKGSVTDFHNDPENMSVVEKPMAEITYPQEYSNSNYSVSQEAPTETQISVFNNLGESEVSASPSFNFQMENEAEKIPEDLKEALNSSDENSLAVYFLKNLYPFSENDGKLFELDPKDQIVFPSLNQTEDSTLNVYEPTEDSENKILNNSIPEISRCVENSSFFSIPYKDSDVNNTANDLQSSISENNDLKSKRYLNDCTEKERSLTSQFLFKDGNDDAAENNNIFIYDSTVQLNDQEEEKEQKINTKINSDSFQNMKALEQKFIFHAPVINISQQNKVLTDNPIPNLTDSKQIFNDFQSLDFDKLFDNLTNYLRNALYSLTNNVIPEQILKNTAAEENNEKFSNSLLSESKSSFYPNNKSTDVFRNYLSNSESNLTSSVGINSNCSITENKTSQFKSNDLTKYNTKEALSMQSSENNVGEHLSIDAIDSLQNKEYHLLHSDEVGKTTQPYQTHPISQNTKSKDSDFLYSKILESDIFSSHIDSSLSSVTNFDLDEPIDNNHNFFKETFTVNEYKNYEPPDLRQRKKVNCTRKEKNSALMKLPVTESIHPKSDAITEPSMSLLGKIFESENEGNEQSLVEIAKRKNNHKTKRKRKKLAQKKKQTVKMIITELPSECFCNDGLNHRHRALCKSPKNSQRNVETQISMRGFNKIATNGDYIYKCDSQTQFDSYEVFPEKNEEKLEYSNQICKSKDLHVSTVSKEMNEVADNKKNPRVQEGALPIRSLRPRQLRQTQKSEIKTKCNIPVNIKTEYDVREIMKEVSLADEQNEFKASTLEKNTDFYECKKGSRKRKKTNINAFLVYSNDNTKSTERKKANKYFETNKSQMSENTSDTKREYSMILRSSSCRKNSELFHEEAKNKSGTYKDKAKSNKQLDRFISEKKPGDTFRNEKVLRYMETKKVTHNKRRNEGRKSSRIREPHFRTQKNYYNKIPRSRQRNP